MSYYRPDRPVAFTAAFNAGSVYDPVNLNCRAHAAEHMLMAGTRQHPTKDKLAAHIEQRGGTIVAYTKLDMLELAYTIGEAGQFGSVVDLLNQQVTDSLYDEGAFASERASVRQELGRLRTEWTQLNERLGCAHLLENTVLGGKIMETETAISAITLWDVQEHIAQRFTGNNLVLVVAGGITLEDAIAEFDRRLNLEQGTAPFVRPPTVVHQLPQDRIRVHALEGADQTRLAYSFAGYTPEHPDNPALDVLTAALGGGRAASLTRILRYGAKLIYVVRAFNRCENYNAWAIYTGTGPDHVAEVVRLINGELNRARNGDFTAEEIAIARDTLINSVPLQLDPIESLPDYHTRADLYRWSARSYIPGWTQAVSAVTPDDIARVAQDIFRPGQSVLTLCGARPTDRLGPELLF
ncbi:MAG TPA: pitrilysin family protein [Candidatus Saccharimonadia bacterium]|nr:pitrilysin family protein [Candidatus Saccharimonadia bacterium]